MLVITPSLCPSWQRHTLLHCVLFVIKEKCKLFPGEKACGTNLSFRFLSKSTLSPDLFQLRNSNTFHEEVIYPHTAFFTLVQCCPSLYSQQASVTPVIPVYFLPILKSLEVTLQRSFAVMSSAS